MSRFWKRFFDIFASALLLVVLSPLFLVIMLAISADSAGGVIFKQKRAGLYSRPFTLYKFRTMYRSAPRDVATAELMEADRYITPVGRFLRQTSLDELPQLWNVLKGDMSLVGPRPEVPFYVEQFKEEIPLYMVKHQVRPGITGWAQVNGFRGDTSICGRIECDIYYIEHWTLFFDIKILFMTLFKGLINSEKLN